MSDLFDLKYLYMDWDDRLKGKDVITSDDVKCLRKYVNEGTNCYDRVHQNECYADAEMQPFVNEKGEEWMYVYYDPNYECKRAYAQGKMIQYRNDDFPEWDDIRYPSWTTNCEYRVKPDNLCRECDNADKWTARKACACTECSPYCTKWKHEEWTKCEDGPKKKRRMTYREFAKWVAQGNGQVKNIDGCYITSRGVEYDIRDDDKSCPDGLLIRGWDEEEWHAPEVEG